MKKLYVLSALMLGTIGAMAQDSYLNDRMTNNSAGLYGTSRFVGMGGAMGALGADISTIGWNPAGIGVMRRSDISFTAGAGWDQKGTADVRRSHGKFDQIGAVLSLPMHGNRLNNVNIGFNYQKKIDFNNSFAVGNVLNGLSQMDQLVSVGNYLLNNNLGPRDVDGYLLPNIVSMAADDKLYHNSNNSAAPTYLLDYNNNHYENPFIGENYQYWQHTWGGLNSFDFNVSGNVRNRVFWGVTFGFDQLRYRSSNEYYEESIIPGSPGIPDSYGDYSVYNDQAVNGYGINAKFGIIVRPIEDNPFRFSFVLETPTKYSIRTNTSMQMEAHQDVLGFPSHSHCYSNEVYCTDDYYGHPFRYSLSTPWKLRLGLGSTIGDYLAFDVDYEFANYKRTKMGDFKYYDDDQSALFQTNTDLSMRDLTRDNFKGSHTLRVGLEGKLTDRLALRGGFNFISSSQQKDIEFSQRADSKALRNATGTYFMRMKPTLIGTMGIGYRWDRVYADLTYKGTAQKATFYPFDVEDARVGALESGVPASEIDKLDAKPSTAKLGRHQITATLGVRF